jgi:hypothetical protein
VSELEDGGHFSFPCLKDSGTGREEISSGYQNIFIFVTVTDTNHFAREGVILTLKNKGDGSRTWVEARWLGAFLREELKRP